MTEIQSLIAQLQGRVQKQTEELLKKEQEVACLKSLILNDKNQLKKIVASMEATGETTDELVG